MRYFYFTLVYFLLMYSSIQSQYNHTSNTAHISIINAINLHNNIIEERLENFEKKTKSKPLMFVNVKRSISDLNNAANNLNHFITAIQDEIGSEKVLYELVADDLYENTLFNSSGELSEKGKELKKGIVGFYQAGQKINIHGLTGLSDFMNQHFNTNETYYDAQENKIDYFQHLFYDRSNYGIMMTLNYLLSDIKVFQLLYYRSVMSY